ncbi:hypothetical protein [Micromonospora echinofusca]|uniref:Uncharacterized protein n=1 Tax=Micromonospora echinofusca TaxID=47858 RepID=A0ABS3W0M2_MICEH|nr:hypothetical protein [Micromonospora echinofusca]MBO4210345.1 hypothetical protein [Micromonospora echinofusca]
MSNSRTGYRLVRRAGDAAPVASTAQPLDSALAAFQEQVRAGGYGPYDGRRLMVVSDEEWSAVSGEPLSTPSGSAAAPTPPAPRWRNLFGRLRSSR